MSFETFNPIYKLFNNNGFTTYTEDLRAYFETRGVKVIFNDHLFLLWCSADAVETAAEDAAANASEDRAAEVEWMRLCNGPIFARSDLRLVCGTQPHMRPSTVMVTPENFKNFHSESMYDGTFLRLYNYDGHWFMATCRMLDAEEARWSSVKSFGELFRECYGVPDPSDLDPACQYYYVMCHPENRLVSTYSTPVVYLVGQSNSETSAPEMAMAPLRMDTDNFDSLQSVFLWFMNNSACQHPRGVVFVCKTTGEKLCYEFPEFTYYRDTLRGNNPRLDYRYLELLCHDYQNGTTLVQEFRRLYPEWDALFFSIDHQLQQVCKNISFEYYKTYIVPRMTPRTPGVQRVYNIDKTSRFAKTLMQLDAAFHQKNIQRVDPTTVYQHLLSRLKPNNLSWLMYWDRREKHVLDVKNSE